jgi:NADPH2:quinone reductase
MRAVVFDRSAPDASATRIADVAVPQPVPGRVAIDVVAAGVNFIDVMARRGDPAYADGWPFVPGLEVAGRYGHSVPGSPGRRRERAWPRSWAAASTRSSPKAAARASA